MRCGGYVGISRVVWCYLGGSGKQNGDYYIVCKLFIYTMAQVEGTLGSVRILGIHRNSSSLNRLDCLLGPNTFGEPDESWSLNP